MRWGTFNTQGPLSIGVDSPADELQEIAKKNGLEGKIVILDFGEQYFP